MTTTLLVTGAAGHTILRNHGYFENRLFTLPGVRAQGGRWFSAAGASGVASLSRDGSPSRWRVPSPPSTPTPPPVAWPRSVL